MSPAERFEKEVQSIVEQLVRKYKPRKIILFGSLAAGTGEPRDIDLFIVKEDVPVLGVDRIRQLDAIINYTLATDFIVYRPEEVRQRLRMGDPFVRSVLDKGKVLYDAE